jgi:endo-1,4-beta-xylanase
MTKSKDSRAGRKGERQYATADFWTTPVEHTPELNPYAGLPEGLRQRLAQRYRDIFSVFVKHRAISRVTFWAVTDANTWLNNWPHESPPLWDRQGRPKPAFDAVVEALRHASTAGA